MEERIAITKMHLGVLYALGIIFFSWRLSTLGMSEIKALVLVMLLAFVPFIIVKTIPALIFHHVMLHSVGPIGYKMYKMMCTDSGCAVLSEYPDQKEVEKTKEKVQKIFVLHPWMRRYDTRVKLNRIHNLSLRTGK